jgi:subtilisin family serine protease
MKKVFYLFICLFLVACGSEKSANISSDTSNEVSSAKVTAQSILSQMDKAKYMDGELLVKFKPSVAAASKATVHKSVGATVVHKYTLVPNLERIKLPEGLTVKDAVTTYMSDPNVEYAEPNYIAHIMSVIPDDTYFGDQWALHNLGTYAGGTYGADIRAVDAWSVSIGEHSVIVAVLDTGVDYTHPDLVGNIWTNTGETSCTDGLDNDGNGYVDDCKGWDFVRCDEIVCDEFDDKDNCVKTKCEKPVSINNDPMDDNGHGTHVAGIAGATGWNSMGVTGVMMRVRLMPVKVLNKQGDGTSADIIAGIDYAVKTIQPGEKLVINASFGVPTGLSGYSEFNLQQLYDAVSDANTAGVLLVAAAGNDSSNNDLAPVYPASFNLPNVIAVAATDQNDRRASFSNFGPASVHVAAPGVYILSTVPVWWSQYQGYGMLDFEMGTSMAAPHVSGLAGLLWSYYSYFNHSQIRGTILRNVDTYLDGKPDLETIRDYVWTDGRINAYKAMWSLLPVSDITYSATTTQIVLNWKNNAVGHDGFKIERKVGGGSYTTIDQALSPDSVSFTDTGLTEGTAYTYRIKALALLPNPPSASAVQAESFPAEKPAATVLNAPTDLKASGVSQSEIDLEWTDNSSTEQGFRIERKTGTDGIWEEIDQVPGTFYTDGGLNKSTSYTYRVRAYNAAVNSEYSNTDSARTKGGGGGGGGSCSIGAKQNAPTAIADLALLLLPLIFIALARRKR